MDSERLLDLYLSGEFAREILGERQALLEKTVSDLVREQAELAAHLEKQMLSEEQIKSLNEFAEKIGANIDAMENDFNSQRRLIEEADVRVVLTLEGARMLIRLGPFPGLHATIALRLLETGGNCVSGDLSNARMGLFRARSGSRLVTLVAWPTLLR